ncbi:UDP-2,3-diacylglucosamine diphosphatase [Cardinium endosymbiont of Bemisia tabaci]|uniref:UDP-2,3-diacylglucosamine diphosphatase n=1 Tax=Cardinium endosymbiont of Bemisia tabaci TaxID=672794 RepID=UPI000442D080|nr:UDP-2,3-diacylglucosamine diphosphatase [Cardinium endosymbiont of Bemisia tabaci]CDG50102.1 UDP-2,3-diacylglucosamine hydrolase [Cardinium endosymbiont cBtQ1 of Bemisia tabaci]CDG50158.1 UDP-2,3-diacylglucosamine hydrolase [Cardinium endosymbiont cBtQ1 of Bemisia tabaci]
MIQIPKIKKKIFFISDVHLPLRPSGTNRPATLEDKIIDWLHHIKPQTQALFLLGDIFDFWFEYKYLVPKGAIRFQATLYAFYSAGIPVYFFLGNHDGWSIDYLTQECGVQLFRKPASITLANKRFLVGHGDTINPTTRYKLFHKLYHSGWLQFFMRMLPADWLYGTIDWYFTKKKGRLPYCKDKYDPPSAFAEKDPIFQYCKDQIEPFDHHEFYIFGHTHCPYIKALNDSSSYCNLGDWVSHDTYACFDGVALSLHKF